MKSLMVKGGELAVASMVRKGSNQQMLPWVPIW